MTRGRKTTLEERIEIVSYCIAHAKDYMRTMQQYNVSYYQIYGWVRKYEAEGPSGLFDRRGRRKNVVPISEIAQLSERRTSGWPASKANVSPEKHGEIIDIKRRIQSEILELRECE